MSVSIAKAFETAISERYNKSNILVFMFVSAVCYTLYFYLKELQNTILSDIVYLCILVIIGGYTSIINHNEINDASNVFPAFSKFQIIITIGIKYFIGTCMLFLIGFLPIAIVGIIFAYIFTYFEHQSIQAFSLIISYSVFCIFACLFFNFRFAIPIFLIFFQNLELKSFFAFKKTKKFLEERKKIYIPYLFKSFIMFITGLCIIFATDILFYILSVPLDVKISNNIFDVIRNTISVTVMCTFLAVISPSLNAQFVNFTKTEYTIGN